MALETATHVDALNTAWPDGTDQRSTADDHLRLIKACLKRTFPQIAGAVSASHAAISFVNDLSASAQAQLNTLRDGSATANNAINSRYANSASVAANIGTIAAANVPNLAGISNTFTGVLTGLAAPIYLSSTTPGMIWYRTSEGTDEKAWRFFLGTNALFYQTINDAGDTAGTFMQFNRSAGYVTDISISCSAVYINGVNALNPIQMNSVAAASYARLDAAQTFAKGTGSTIVQLGTSGTITPNCEDGNVFRIGPLTGNVSFAAPSNLRSGQTIVLHIIQGAGGHTASWNSIYKFAGSVDPTLTTAASAVDVFAFSYDSSSNALRQAGLNVG